MMRTFATLLALSASPLALAGPAMAGAVEKQPLNVAAIGMFMVFVVLTLGITYWASRRTRSASDFYTAGGGITGFQNGLAIAGDYMSAATLLGPVQHGVCQRLRWLYLYRGFLCGLAHHYLPDGRAPA